MTNNTKRLCATRMMGVAMQAVHGSTFRGYHSSRRSLAETTSSISLGSGSI